MRIISGRTTAGLGFLLAFNTLATTHYVDINSANPAAPYTTWSTAATAIQDAVNTCATGDTVLVTNGIYATGGMVAGDAAMNRVAVTNAITVQSVNGPWETIIQGGPSQVRCVWLTNNATLIGFTVEGGTTLNSVVYGAGVGCTSSNSLVENCVIVSNTAGYSGAAAYQGTYYNCLISSNNSLSLAAAVYNASLNNCTIVNNSCEGVVLGVMTNCIDYYNTGGNEASVRAIVYSCVTPAVSGAGNFTNAPLLFADNVHLLSNSPCIGAGINLVTGTDIFGAAWASPPSIGCAEYTPTLLVTQPAANLTANPIGFSVSGIASVSNASFMWLQNGIPLQDNGNFSGTSTTNIAVASVSLGDAGSYQLVISNAFGVATSAVMTLGIHCVNAAGSSPVSPYSTWATAATNIQDAITASANGDIVLVTNGIYTFGGVSMDGTSLNRVALNKTIRVQSVNGPWATTILGGGATNGSSAIRCAWLTNNAALVGFALKQGATQTIGNGNNSESGGGVWCASSNSFVYNCAIISNAASSLGGGVYQGTLNNCLISGNLGNTAAYGANLNSCTIVSNSVFGVRSGTMTNCISYYNQSNSQLNYITVTAASYCCTTPAITGTGNITAAPGLQPDGVHLATASPCIQAGTNIVAGADIFGRSWANPPSIGCAEFVFAPTASQPVITVKAVGFTIGNVSISGFPPFSFLWLENGIPLTNNGHFSSTQSSNLLAAGVSLADSGSYQLVVSNAYGAVTSAAVALSVHAVDAAGADPVPPFLSWATAATNIQDAIEAASAGDIVLVTNGIYDTGGEAYGGGQTNRVTLDKALTVVSVNGWAGTIIEGAFDPVSTNGPVAVRCAWLTNGAILSGFTLTHGATLNTGGVVAQSGGGAWCLSTNALVANSMLTNNFAAYGGGGIYSGTLNSSVVIYNVATFGGGAYAANLNNCTVEDNYIYSLSGSAGAGTYFGIVRNSIVIGNMDGFPEPILMDNYQPFPPQYSYCCSQSQGGQAPLGTGNIASGPYLLDLYHIPANSPCRGAGSALYATGTDLDGESWNNPPSIGCDEFVASNRVGPLSVSVVFESITYPPQTNVLVGRYAVLDGIITGLASSVSWNFGDGTSTTNASVFYYHEWANPGNYNVIFTAYNDTYPAGVSTNLMVQVVPVAVPQLQPPLLLSNGNIQFQFAGQAAANFVVQYATNITPPVTWVTLATYSSSAGGTYQIQDAATNTARFYRVRAQ